MDFGSNEADRIALNFRYGAALRIEFPSNHKPFFSLWSRFARGGWSFDMDCTKPADVVATMIDASLKKLAVVPRDLLIRGALSGALLGAAASLALGGAIATGQPLVLASLPVAAQVPEE
jgi:hypothetical protein